MHQKPKGQFSLINHLRQRKRITQLRKWSELFSPTTFIDLRSA